jgi:rhodanese-related sulfurtransferase
MLERFPVDHLIPVSAADMAEALCRGEQVLDVRAPVEWDDGHIKGSTHVYVPELTGDIPDAIDPEKPTWIMCGSGYRAAMAGGLLRRHGMSIRVFGAGGVDDVKRAGDASDIPCDLPLLVGT